MQIMKKYQLMTVVTLCVFTLVTYSNTYAIRSLTAEETELKGKWEEAKLKYDTADKDATAAKRAIETKKKAWDKATNAIKKAETTIRLAPTSIKNFEKDIDAATKKITEAEKVLNAPKAPNAVIKKATEIKINLANKTINRSKEKIAQITAEKDAAVGNLPALKEAAALAKIEHEQTIADSKKAIDALAQEKLNVSKAKTALDKKTAEEKRKEEAEKAAEKKVKAEEKAAEKKVKAEEKKVTDAEKAAERKAKWEEFKKSKFAETLTDIGGKVGKQLIDTSLQAGLTAVTGAIKGDSQKQIQADVAKTAIVGAGKVIGETTEIDVTELTDTAVAAIDRNIPTKPTEPQEPAAEEVAAPEEDSQSEDYTLSLDDDDSVLSFDDEDLSLIGDETEEIPAD